MGYALPADVLVILHLGVVIFVVGGEIAVLAGAGRGWRWVRNIWFRATHLGVVGIVAAQAALGYWCPLTVWEYELRERAGQQPEEIGFIARMARGLIYYDAPAWVFTTLYVVFAGLVVATLVLVPPLTTKKEFYAEAQRTRRNRRKIISRKGAKAQRKQ